MGGLCFLLGDNFIDHDEGDNYEGTDLAKYHAPLKLNGSSRSYTCTTEPVCGLVASSFMGHRRSTPLLQGQSWLRTIQGLNLALLVNTEDQSLVRWIEGEPDHVRQLLDTLEIATECERLDLMGLEAVGLPDAVHGSGAHADHGGEDAGCAVRRCGGCAVGAFPDGHSALMLVAARLRHIASTKWGKRRYLSMETLMHPVQEEAATA
jgi:hypothetical protein